MIPRAVYVCSLDRLPDAPRTGARVDRRWIQLRAAGRVQRTWTVPLVGMLALMVSCRDEPSQPVAPHGARWTPVAGLPLPGHGTPEQEKADWAPPFEQLTSTRLVEIAHAFHPRLDPARYTPAELEQRYQRAPERIAMEQLQHAAWQRIDTWRALVRAVRAELPEGYRGRDATAQGQDAAYFAVFSAPRDAAGSEDKLLVVHLGFLVPFYWYYEIHIRRVEYPSGEKLQREPLRDEVTPALAPVLALVEREIDARYGYRRISPAIAATKLPGLYVDGAQRPTVVTLADALFSPHRW